MKIENPETKVSKGMELNDRDYITCLLTSLKDIEKNYTIALTEASCKNLYNKHKETFLNIAELQREVYELMFQKGWYKLETAENTKIKEKHQTLSQELNDLKS